MPLVEGWCTVCRRHAADHPRLCCPWCEEQATVGIRGDLGLGPDAPPREVFDAVGGQLRAIAARQRELRALRREAALVALRDIAPLHMDEVTGVGLRRVQQWAGLVGPRRRGPAPKDPRPRKDSRRLREAWRAHEARIERLGRLLAELPDPEPVARRLRPPLVPPEVADWDR